jgi:integrase
MVLDRRTAREHSVLAGLEGFCHEQGLTSPLATEVVAAYLCQGLRDRASSTKGTYHAVLRHVGTVTEPKGAPRFAGSLAPSPYKPAERAQLYGVAASQRRPWRRYSAAILLALGLGAGLRAGELIAAKGRDVIIDEVGVSLRVRGARQRLVTLRGHEAVLLRELVGRKNAYLFHPEQASRCYPNFVNDFCRQLVASPDAAKFSAPRARSSYICDQLAASTALSALLAATGIVEVESLLRYARHVPGAPRSKAALRHQLANERS